MERGVQLCSMPGSAKRAARACGRAKAKKRLPVEVREQLLGATYAGQPFWQVLGDLDLTANQVWGPTKTDPQWSAEHGQSGTTDRARLFRDAW